MSFNCAQQSILNHPGPIVIRKPDTIIPYSNGGQFITSLNGNQSYTNMEYGIQSRTIRYSIDWIWF